MWFNCLFLPCSQDNICKNDLRNSYKNGWYKIDPVLCLYFEWMHGLFYCGMSGIFSPKKQTAQQNLFYAQFFLRLKDH